MADRTPDTNQLRKWSDTSMGYALRQDLEPNAYSTVHAIDALRLAVLAAATDLVDALNERAALAAGTRVSVVDDEDDDLTMATASGYHCVECDFHVLVDDPDYDARAEAHDAFHDAADQAGRRNQGQVEQFLQHVEDRLFYASSQSVDPDDVDRLVRMCRAVLTPGVASQMLSAWTPAETGGAR